MPERKRFFFSLRPSLINLSLSGHRREDWYKGRAGQSKSNTFTYFHPAIERELKDRQCLKRYIDLVVSYWLFVKFDHTSTNSERQCCLNWSANALLCVLRYFAAIRENSLNLNLPSPSITLRAATFPHKSGSLSFFQWHLLLYISNVFPKTNNKSWTSCVSRISNWSDV